MQLDGSEIYDLEGLEKEIKPQQELTLVIYRKSGQTDRVQVTLRIDTPIEIDYYQHGGILPYVLRQLANKICALLAVRALLMRRVLRFDRVGD